MPVTFEHERSQRWPIEARWQDLVGGVRAGDILMTRGWFDDEANAEVKRIYEEARRK